MKASINQSEYLQTIALLALAKMHTRKVNDARDAIRELLDCAPDSNEGYHVDDEVWGTDDPDADSLLKRMRISVKKKAK